MIQENGKKIFAFIQARYFSNRLPGKVCKKLVNNLTVLDIVIKRLKKSKKVSNVIVLTTKKNNKEIIATCKKNKVKFFKGSENNVLDRFYNAAKKYDAKNIVRITADCPLIDISILDENIDIYLKNNLDYISNINPPSFPDGLDIEIFNFKSLSKSWRNAKSNFDREHVTQYILRNNSFKKKNIANKINYSTHRWTLDTKEDLILLKFIFNYFKPDIYFSWKKVLKLLSKNPSKFKVNAGFERNFGMKMNKGQKLWKRARKIIAGGNHLFSKRPEIFLPDKWPTYYSKAKGCFIWDMENKKYTDVSLMGVGTNILGYSNNTIDNAVIKKVKKSNLSTLNSFDDIKLAEKLIEMHPWLQMVRFTRSGGEANAVAIRLARAATGKDNIAVCGYHGWHDWYMSANIQSNKNLDSLLMKNLSNNGVPKGLKNTVFPFRYNDFNELKKIVEKNDIGIIKMEVMRNEKPKNNFLKNVRQLAKKKKIVLIFDECTSGFRETFGGLHIKEKIYPDMLILGKALGNGYAINAILGREDIMHAAENTFISSTFWSERSGPVAALATLKLMEKIQSWKIITKKGIEIKKNWTKIAKIHNIDLEVSGIESLPSFKINNNDWNKYKTYISQEMLKKKFLAGNTIYVCINHNNKILEKYYDELDKIFKKIKNCMDEKEDINNILETNECATGFYRLN